MGASDMNAFSASRTEDDGRVGRTAGDEGAESGRDRALRELAAWNHRGSSRHARGDYEGAIADFDRALEFDRDCPEIYNNRGAVRFARGDYEGAIADFDRALALRPRYPEALNNRGAARHARGDFEGAVADFDWALALKPDYAAAWDNRGGARHALGDLEGAIADFDRALALGPREAAAAVYHHRAGVHVTRRDFGAAIADLDRALQIDPGHFVAYITRGNARHHVGDPAAHRDYGMAFRLAPGEVARELVRKMADDFRRGPAAVLADCARHLRANPSDAVARARRGVTRLLQGRDADAQMEFGLILRLHPEWAEYLRRLIEEARRCRGGVAPRAETPSPRPSRLAGPVIV
jgi:tetratricopeptide (TPR) repeat protein